MLARLLSNRLGFYLFSAAATRVVGGKTVADLPNIQFPTKPKPTEDERFPMSLAYQTMNYLRKDRLPNCRYFALQYQNRIYHFYNAYYYPLGRMMNRVASEIRGRTSPHYKNHMANVKNGDICVIVNIEDPLVTGKKLLFKKLRYHTGFIGHLREYSYKHVLNHKPQLLYHFLLRKVMPKNKLSKEYLQNLILCRGPTHSFSQFPQFAPDKRIYSLLPQTDLLEMLKKDPSVKLIQESSPGEAESILGKKTQKYLSESEKEQLNRERDEVIEDLTKVHKDVAKFKKVPSISEYEFDVLKRKQKRIQERYKPIRAPYRKTKQNWDHKLKVYTSEKKARKDPNYQLLKDQELEEIDEENTAPNVHVIGGAVKKEKEDQ